MHTVAATPFATPPSTSKDTLLPSRDPAISIKPATLDDIDELVRMFAHLHAFNASLNEQFELAGNWEAMLRHQLEATHGEERTAIWIAWQDGLPAGLLMVEEQHGSPLFAQRRWAEITGIFVEREHRGTDVSHNLIARAYDWASSRKLDDIRLYVTTNNDRARAFYESEGFTHIQEIWSRPITPEQ